MRASPSIESCDIQSTAPSVLPASYIRLDANATETAVTRKGMTIVVTIHISYLPHLDTVLVEHHLPFEDEHLVCRALGISEALNVLDDLDTVLLINEVCEV